MVSLESFIGAHTYIALFLGTVIVGEIVLVIGGFLAHRGYLELALVIIISLLATIMSDQALFFFGRLKGKKILKKHRSLRRKVERIHRFIEKHEGSVLFFFRFIYGTRAITPIAIGTSNVKTGKFMLINAVSALVWVLAFGLAGFFFGVAMEGIFGKIKHIELELLFFLVLIAGVVWLVKHLRKKKGKKN